MPKYFNPPAPCGAGRLYSLRRWSSAVFQPTRPVRGGTAVRPSGRWKTSHFNPPAPCGAGRKALLSVKEILEGISTHPPRAGRDFHIAVGDSAKDGFQPTRPVRGGTTRYDATGRVCGHFNPPAPCGAGLPSVTRSMTCWTISTHPPRAGRDTDTAAEKSGEQKISTHPPRAGRDALFAPRTLTRWALFQPTRPVRGGTAGGMLFGWFRTAFQPTRPVRGGTENRAAVNGHPDEFQPTRPVRGGTAFPGRERPAKRHFNPPAPCGAGLSIDGGAVFADMISTHPPRAGRDVGFAIRYFMTAQFQPTRPVRGGTSPFCIFSYSERNFNPPAPCGAGRLA